MTREAGKFALGLCAALPLLIAGCLGDAARDYEMRIDAVTRYGRGPASRTVTATYQY